MDRVAIVAGVVALLTSISEAKAEVIQTCTFPTLPHLIMRHPDDLTVTKTMAVGGRPEVPMEEGQGQGRVASATVDGYLFLFAPANSVLDVSRDGKEIARETGSCVTVGAPVRQEPLKIGPTPAQTKDLSPAETAPATPTIADQGDWDVSHDKSAFDDTDTVVLRLDSLEHIRGNFGGSGPATLLLRCMENTTSVYLTLNDHFLADIQGYGRVEYRIDGGKAASANMKESTDNKALGLWRGTQAIPFIKTLMTGERVVMRATPFNESPVEFEFRLAGITEAIKPLRSACKW